MSVLATFVLVGMYQCHGASVMSQLNLTLCLDVGCLSRFVQQGGGWSGGAMVLGKLPVPGRPAILITVGQWPIALAVGAGGGGLDIFTLIYPFSPLSPSLWETARYRLKYCLKGPLNPKQPTNQIVQQGQDALFLINQKNHCLLLHLHLPGRFHCHPSP